MIGAPRALARPTLVTAGLTAAAALAPVRSLQQLLYVGAFALAAGAFWVWGQTLGRRALGGIRLGTFTAIYLGELAALAAAAVASAALGLADAAAGVALPLSVPFAASALLLARRRGRGERPSPAPSGAPDLLTPLAAGCVALVVALWARQVAAVGLDTHEHTAWVEQILARGHIPLAEPGTRILGDYPRSFHLLTALWAAAGPGLPSGPFLKAMPFLQTALPLLAIGELLVASGVRRDGEVARAPLQAVVAVGWLLFLFALVPAAYPVPDLSGTPRLSSNALLLAPAVLVLLAAVERAPRPAALALGAWPLLAAWALTWNPIVPVLLAAVAAPAAALFWAALRPPLDAPARRGAARAAVAAAALAAVVAAQDPWIVSQAAVRSPRVAAALRRATGLVAFDEAVRGGTATAREKSVRNAQARPPCRDLACALRLAARAAREALGSPGAALRAARDDARALAAHPDTRTTQTAFRGAVPLQPNALGDHAALPYLAIVACGAAAAIAGALRPRAGPAPAGAPSAGRLLAVAAAAVLAAGVLLALAANLAGAFDDATHERVILDGYLHFAPYHVSVALLGLPFLFAWTALAAPLARRAARAGAPPRLVGALALAAWAALPLAARGNLWRISRDAKYVARADLGDVRALRRLERLVPPEDGVLVPAEHANIEQWEHWVLPVGPTAALLPYGDRRYLFDVYLGASYPLSWRDLEDDLCGPSAERRRAFLARERVRWWLERDPPAGDPPAVPPLCGRTPAALGLELAPVAEERGIHLFRLRSLEM